MKSLFILLILATLSASGQNHNFRIRTITAGVNLNSLSDTTSFLEAVDFLKQTRQAYLQAGYEVQTIRISTQNLYLYGYKQALPPLTVLDKIAKRENIVFSIGNLLPPDVYDPNIASWVVRLIKETETISFSLPISSKEAGVFPNSIKASAEITEAISKNSIGGEGNFRFTASANCPPNIPFFPAAYHSGPKSFGIGLESPNLLTEVFKKSTWANAKENLKKKMETSFTPIQVMALKISETSGWAYDGIDTSPAPGLDASIGEAVETITKQPFGGSSTLRACAMITDVLKSLDLKTCGYSGLMLPVIEDKILAQRATENRYTVQELLLFSSVSGTGLDVIPLPGNTSRQTLERIYFDVAALSLKYTNKALSARLFLIPGKEAGDQVVFENPFLTTATVMRIE